MAFTADEKFAPLEQKVWLATPTMGRSLHT